MAVYEQYREKLMTDPAAIENVRRADESGCILNEDRAIMQRVPAVAS